MLRLRYLRERENLSQIEVAKLLNVAPNTLSQYENGRRDPDTNTLIRRRLSMLYKHSTRKRIIFVLYDLSICTPGSMWYAPFAGGFA